MNQNAGTKTLAQKATLNRSADVLAESLAAAVQAGMTEKAAEIAAELSKLQIKCEIQVLAEENEIRSQHPEFTVKVHVEDRISDGCFISITVKSSDTIGDLKRRVMILHNFPMEVQRWIIGKKIYPDQTRLHQCGVKGAGHTLYLYLVTAHSVGLSKESYEAQLQAIMLMNQANAAPIKQIPSVPGALPSSLDSALRDSGVHDTHKASTISSSGDSLEQTGVIPLTVGSGSYSSLSSSARIQGMLLTPPLSHLSGNFPGTPSTPAENVLSHASPALNADAWAFIPAATTSAPQTSTINTNSNSNNPAMVSAASAVTGPPVENEEMREGWSCPACTFRNLPMWPGCEICNQQRPEDYQIPENYQMTERELHLIHDEQVLERLTREGEDDLDNTRMENYQHLLAIENLDLVPNPEPFQCAICFDDIAANDGIVLRECLHQFCRECLQGAVQHCEDAALTCPYQDNQYSCKASLQEREIRALVPEALFYKFLQRGLDQAESQTENSYHCKTANCPGWCVYEDTVNFFTCPVCEKMNCLTCKAIHQGQNCQQYQDELRILASNDPSAKQTHEMLKNLVSSGEAMHCPKCLVVVQKKGGCDWIRCSICKTEICWVTKGPRWGPNGEGDFSGGCKCRLNGKKCHPHCVNCH